MRLLKVRVENFQSIVDSNEFEVGDITCLVGKNESGKTALLQAMYRLNPIKRIPEPYDAVDHFPRWNLGDYQDDLDKGTRDPAVVCTATYEVEKADLKELIEKYGNCIELPLLLTLYNGYSNELEYDLPVRQELFLASLISQYQFDPPIRKQLKNCSSLEEIIEALAPEICVSSQSANSLKTACSTIIEDGGIESHIFDNFISERIPKFLYFDEYYIMTGRDNLELLIKRIQNGDLKNSDYPLLGLLKSARLDVSQLADIRRTWELKNRLNGASAQLQKEIVKYWSQNKHIQLAFDIREAKIGDPDGMTTGHNIWGEVVNTKQSVNTEIGSRSKGFVWFFSFLAWYSDVKRRNENVILLLDEPGLSLHAKAQEDLLRFFESEILGVHQLIYTTHSPFMVDSRHFDRVRIVQDRTNEDLEHDNSVPLDGTKVLSDVLEATEDSLFPLQGALGYEVHQTLFIGPNSLVVEGVSDLLYLQAMSALLEKKDMNGLDSRWVITPVGGAGKVPAFVALIGAQTRLNIAVLMDFQKEHHQLIENLYKNKLLEKKKILTFAQFVEKSEADIEDMFEREFYFNLVNAEFSGHLSKKLLADSVEDLHERILANIGLFLNKHSLKKGIGFNHYRPARYFVEHISELQDKISDNTLKRFDAAFYELNRLLA